MFFCQHVGLQKASCGDLSWSLPLFDRTILWVLAGTTPTILAVKAPSWLTSALTVYVNHFECRSAETLGSRIILLTVFADTLTKRIFRLNSALRVLMHRLRVSGRVGNSLLVISLLEPSLILDTVYKFAAKHWMSRGIPWDCMKCELRAYSCPEVYCFDAFNRGLSFGVAHGRFPNSGACRHGDGRRVCRDAVCRRLVSSRLWSFPADEDICHSGRSKLRAVLKSCACSAPGIRAHVFLMCHKLVCHFSNTSLMQQKHPSLVWIRTPFSQQFATPCPEPNSLKSDCESECVNYDHFSSVVLMSPKRSVVAPIPATMTGYSNHHKRRLSNVHILAGNQSSEVTAAALSCMSLETSLLLQSNEQSQTIPAKPVEILAVKAIRTITRRWRRGGVRN